MIDTFASEYKWLTHEILQHTYHQLKVLGTRIVKRRSTERRIFADSVRAANHADRGQYDRFLQSLEPEQSVEEIIQERESAPVSTPEGMTVREDF